MINKLTVLATMALVISGCATQDYGNTATASMLSQKKLAADAATFLVPRYAPAHTQVLLQQSTPDVFGSALVTDLREAGYAVQLFDDHSNKAVMPAKSAVDTLTANVPMSYAVSQKDSLLVLTIRVNNIAYTRAYIEDSAGKTLSQGPWSQGAF